MKNEYRWHHLDDCFPKAFSFLAAPWAFINKDSVLIVVLQQSFQRAVSTYRKRKGQDIERLKRDRFSPRAGGCLFAFREGIFHGYF